jgi:hypothetical protein
MRPKTHYQGVGYDAVRILVILLLTSLGGCGRRIIPPPPTPKPTPLASSAILDTLIQKAVATQKDACHWQQGGSGAGSSSGENRMNAKKHVTGSLQCRPEVLDKVLRALKGELEKEAQAAGVQVHNPSEDVKEGRLEGFAFEYTATTKVHGEVNAATERTADAGGQKARYKLNVSIDEKFP